MNENIQFFQAFLKNPLAVGAVTPSSPELALKMIENIIPNENNIVLELGVGTGSFTKALRLIVHNEKSYLGLEINRAFVRALRRELPDMKIIGGNAAKAVSLHCKSNLGKVGYIISGIPFVTLPNETGDEILEEISRFMDAGNCIFRTFQYAHGYYFPSAIKLRDFMKSRYGKAEKSPLIFKNVPPAYTLTWKTVQ
ncbi:MAG: class I SAM-dependent methyltransferase [Pyrinomonadaceae bacterium]